MLALVIPQLVLFLQENSVAKEKKAKKNNKMKKNSNTIKSSHHRKVLIIGDSHVRDLGDCLRQRLPSKFHVESCCLPNGKFQDITRCLPGFTKKLKKDDAVFIVGGTNDISSQNFTPNFDLSPVDIISKKCNVVIGEIPYRYDRMNLNNNIYNTNCFLYSNSMNIRKLEFSSLSRSSYTKHGLHLNLQGKHIIARQMKDILQNFNFLE